MVDSTRILLGLKVFDDGKLTGFLLIKRCIWLGAKIPFIVLAVIGLMIWLGMGILIVYKCVKLNVSPLEFIRAVDQTPSNLRPPILGSKIATVLVAPLGLVAVGTIYGIITAGAVGVAAVVIQRCRGITRL